MSIGIKSQKLGEAKSMDDQEKPCFKESIFVGFCSLPLPYQGSGHICTTTNYWGLKICTSVKRRDENYILYVSVSNKGKCSTVSGYEQNFRLPSLPPSQLCDPLQTAAVAVASIASVSLSEAACPLCYTLFKSSCYKSAGIVTRGSTFYAQKWSPLSQVVCSMFC